MKTIPCTLIRGGSSRGAYFSGEFMPADVKERDALLVKVMGGPDALQVNGMGGGHPLTSKVAIVDASSSAEADVDYLFLQVDPQRLTVSDRQNCGNILAGVGLYAIDEGLVEPSSPKTIVRVRMQNTNTFCHLELETPNGEVAIDGDASIDGVPGTQAPIICTYLDVAGSSCGALLPTGSVVDEVDGVAVTCVDNGMPVVVIQAQDVGIEGDESPELLDTDTALKARLESIRLQIGPRMNLGDVSEASVPKMCLVSPAQAGGLVMTRTFIPHVCHKSIGVLGAVSAATACLLPGSSVQAIVAVPPGNPKEIAVEHPSGSLSLNMLSDEAGITTQAGVVRTGRIIFKGQVYI